MGGILSKYPVAEHLISLASHSSMTITGYPASVRPTVLFATALPTPRYIIVGALPSFTLHGRV